MRDRTGLLTAATGTASTPLSRYLYVRAIADLSEWPGFVEAMETAHIPRHSSGTLGAAVTAQRFETDAVLIDLMAPTLASELAPFTPSVNLLRLLRALIRLLEGRMPSLGPAWAGVLESSAGGGTALAAFEGDLASLDRRFAGPFLNGELYGLYYRAQLHAAFERACIHYVDGLASERAAAAFARGFDDAPSGLWADVARWCRDRAAAKAGRGLADQLLADLRTVSGLSEPALHRSLGDIEDLLPYVDARHVVTARAAFARLDTRPGALRRASQVTSDFLSDVPLGERLYQRMLDLAAADYPESAVWTAQYHGDARTLTAQASDPGLGTAARFDALSYLLDISADTDATFAGFERLLAEQPDNWDERQRYLEKLEQAHRYAAAARVASAWLATHGPDRGFDYIFATTALSRQYFRMGQLEKAYALLEPLQRSYQLGVLQRSARTAVAMGRLDLADQLARRVVARCPGSAEARITLAEVRWAQGRSADVPAVLHDPQHVLSWDDWRHTVAPVFARVFGRRPAALGEAAFDALARGVPTKLLDALPAALADSGYYPLALALKERLLPPPGAGRAGGDDGAAVVFYRYVVAARGLSAGRAWLAQRWSPDDARRQALSIYRDGLYDLLWELDAVPDNGPEGSYYWLMRALAWLQDPRRDATHRERGARLKDFYRRPEERFYHLAGRCLLGMESDEALLRFATSPHRRAEVSYYLGIKALSERRYNEASDWLRVSVETQSLTDWETLWAKDLLYRWTAAQRELRVAVPRVAARPPTW
jgi:hypothetical protein